jgi:hypothetical protein
MEWISVKDQLPSSAGQYLVFVKSLHNGFISARMKVARFNKGNNHKKSHFYANETYKTKDITHWMSLPNPPAEHAVDEV